VVDLNVAYFGNSVSDLNALIDADVTALNAFQVLTKGARMRKSAETYYKNSPNASHAIK
jgi:hypothetical protein